MRARRCAPRNRWEPELGRGTRGGDGHGTGTHTGAGDSHPPAMWPAGWAGGWVCGCPPPHPPVLDVNDIFKKKKNKNGGKNPQKILIMHLANLSLGRAGKEADNWFAEQCHCLLL